MRYLFELGGEHAAMARAEIASLLPQAQDWAQQGNLLLCTTTDPPPRRLALTKAAYEVLAHGSEEELATRLSVRKAPRPRSARYFCKDAPKNESFRLLNDWLGRPRIDLSAPEETYGVFGAKDELYVVREAWRNREDFEARKSHRRPAPHPTALHPKLARAMVNLSGARTAVLDPFCGAGGILLEAALMGLRAEGVDIDPSMVERSRRNLSHYGVEARLSQGDARTWPAKAEAIVTDAPYGRNSKASELSPLISDFLDHAATRTRRLVIGLPDLTDNEALIDSSPWKVESSYEWPLHRSLKKEVYVLSTPQDSQDAPGEADRRV